MTCRSAKLPKILLAAIYNFGPALLMFLFLTAFHFQILSPVYGWGLKDRSTIPFKMLSESTENLGRRTESDMKDDRCRDDQ